MKKLILVLTIALALSSVANAQNIFTLNDFDKWSKTWDNPVGNNTNWMYWNNLFNFNLGAGMTSEGFASVAFGHTWGVNGFFGLDLLNYDKFMLIVDNCSGCTRNIMANIWLTTGWTDAPWSEPSIYYQGDWTWLLPGDAIAVEIDLASVQNRNHVTGIGVSYGININPNANPNNHYEIPPGWNGMIGSVHPIPEPGALLLLGSGLVGFGVIARIRRKRS